MSGRISDLRPAPPRDGPLGGSIGGWRIETLDKARQEDKLRSKRLTLFSEERSGPESARAARLAMALDHNVSGGYPLQKSLASSVYFRDLRIRVIDHSEKLLSAWKEKDVRFVTIIPPKWFVRRNKLRKTSLRQLKRSLRSALTRVRITSASGVLVGAIHGEYQKDTGYFSIHFHGAATGGVIDVIEELRKRPDFIVSRFDDLGLVLPPPIRLVRCGDRKRQISYLFKSYWSERRVMPNGFVKCRIEEPVHTKLLIWQHDESVEDLFIMFNSEIRGGKMVEKMRAI